MQLHGRSAAKQFSRKATLSGCSKGLLLYSVLIMKSSMNDLEGPITIYPPCTLCRIPPEAEPMSVDVISDDLITQDDDIERASRSLKAMSHPLRLKILCTLGDHEVSVQDIVDHVGTSQSNISQHLAILRDKGILASRKDANRVYYRVGDSRTLRLIGMMRDVFCSRQ
jgi:ArsR family transcriptional regulator